MPDLVFIYIVKEAKRYHHMEICDEQAVTEYKDS